MSESNTITIYKSCCKDNLCILPHTTKCCWHEDIRRNKNIMYIDGYGDVDVSYYGITVPMDLYYCPSCKKTDDTISGILDKLNKLMENPEDYHKRRTLEQNMKQRLYRDRLRAKLLKRKSNIFD